MAKPRILVVDDEAGIRFIIRKMLDSAGYEVIEADSGEMSLEILDRDEVDLVIMDIMMPGIDGWDTTRKIKGNKATRNIPIAILSVRGAEEDKVKSFQEALADAHIEKPIIMEKTLRTIEWLLKNYPKKTSQEHGK